MCSKPMHLRSLNTSNRLSAANKMKQRYGILPVTEIFFFYKMSLITGYFGPHLRFKHL